MTWVDSLTKSAIEKLDTKWDRRDGVSIPSTDTIALKDGAVKIDAAFLYADLAGSSKLAEVCPWETTAKIIRSYLDICIRNIKIWGGEIRSFDGDRVMGIFMGGDPCYNATNCAREIDWMVDKVLKASFGGKVCLCQKI